MLDTDDVIEPAGLANGVAEPAEELETPEERQRRLELDRWRKLRASKTAEELTADRRDYKLMMLEKLIHRCHLAIDALSTAKAAGSNVVEWHDGNRSLQVAGPGEIINALREWRRLLAETERKLAIAEGRYSRGFGVTVVNIEEAHGKK